MLYFTSTRLHSRVKQIGLHLLCFDVKHTNMTQFSLPQQHAFLHRVIYAKDQQQRIKKKKTPGFDF